MNQRQLQQPEIKGWQYLGMVLIAGFPLWCGIFLYALNPSYIGRLVRVGPTQPLGWIAISLIVVLVGLAYAGLLSSYWFIPAAQRLKRRIAVGLVIVVLVLPGLIVMLLAPAVLLIVQTFQVG